ncbi:MAG: ferredoxin [Candidatus Binatia bacterium]
MRVIVKRELCEGNAVCVGVAPEVFALGDDDQARLRVERPGEALRAKVEDAVRRCPRQALAIEED